MLFLQLFKKIKPKCNFSLKNQKNNAKIYKKIYKLMKGMNNQMYLIAGLGNPETDYANTRHNMGFDVINEIANRKGFNVIKKNFKGLYEITIIHEKKVLFLKPQTFMNLSGESIKEVIDFYKIPLEKILVIYDDIDVEKGKIRIRKTGNAGSHNGMKSIIDCLNSTDFARLRVGIGQPEYKDDLINYVIGFVPEEERNILKKGIYLAADAIDDILKYGIDIAMNKYN